MFPFPYKEFVAVFDLIITGVDLWMQSSELIQNNCPLDVSFFSSVAESSAQPAGSHVGCFTLRCLLRRKVVGQVAEVAA